MRTPWSSAIDSSAAEKMPGVKAVHPIVAPAAARFVRIDQEKKQLVFKHPQGMEEKTIDLALNPWLYRNGKEVKADDLKEGDTFVIGWELYYAGDKVIALAADTEEHARDALRAVKVTYTPLAFLVKEAAALKQPALKTIGGNIKSNVQVAGQAEQGRRRRRLQASSGGQGRRRQEERRHPRR